MRSFNFIKVNELVKKIEDKKQKFDSCVKERIDKIVSGDAKEFVHMMQFPEKHKCIILEFMEYSQEVLEERKILWEVKQQLDKNKISLDRIHEIAEKTNDADLQYALAEFYRHSWGYPEGEPCKYWAKKAAQNGHHDAIYRLNDPLFYGEENKAECYKVMEELANEGYLNAVYTLADHYRDNSFEILSKYENCDDGDILIALADMYVDGTQTFVNIEKAVNLYLDAVQTGKNETITNRLRELIERFGKEYIGNIFKKIIWTKSDRVQYWLADDIKQVYYLPDCEELAFEIFQSLAEKGHDYAKHYLACHYYLEEVENERYWAKKRENPDGYIKEYKDIDKAEKLFDELIEKGCGVGVEDYARFCLDKQYPNYNFEKGISLLWKACECGQSLCMFLLAEYLFKGKEIAMDRENALLLLQTTKEYIKNETRVNFSKEYLDYYIGRCYFDNIQIPADYLKAQQHFENANTWCKPAKFYLLIMKYLMYKDLGVEMRIKCPNFIDELTSLANSNIKQAALLLADCYANGIATNYDPRASLYWLDYAEDSCVMEEDIDL